MTAAVLRHAAGLRDTQQMLSESLSCQVAEGEIARR